VTELNTTREDVILRLARDPRLAHAALFKHRHPSATPPFHMEMLEAWWAPDPYVITEAFRGGAKSTLAEEAITLMACFGMYRNIIIVGESETRANERLGAVKNEIETNPYIMELFGDLVGGIWQERKIVLANGVVVQAFGRQQSLRGAKHLQWRPDLLFCDDMEDDECVATPEAREKFKSWFLKVVRPALDPKHKIRIAGTPLDPEAFLLKLKASPEWKTVTFPIEYIDEFGERQATWPGRFPLSEIDRIRKSYEDLGAVAEYMQEYMCEATDPGSKAFTADMIKVEPVLRTWQATYACYDPARTVKNRSAFTGKAVWSWVNNRLIIWDSAAEKWKPDEQIADMFKVSQEFNPIEIGVEENGLHEFIMQPLRHEQIRRQETLPIRSLMAPKGKLDFIRSLQPFFKAGEVIFAKDMPALRNQLLSFPTGFIDIPNALAYALRMRPGQPIYDGFTVNHVVEELPLSRDTVWLAVNATQGFTCAAACQVVRGALHVTHDWVREGDVGTHLSDIVAAARLETGRAVRLVAGPAHFATHDKVGLRGAARRIPQEVHRGRDVLIGREEIRKLFGRSKHGQPAFQIATAARWTLNGLSGGYAREVSKSGLINEFAVEGAYKVLLEGIESFAALIETGATDTERDDLNWQETGDGRRFISARAG